MLQNIEKFFSSLSQTTFRPNLSFSIDLPLSEEWSLLTNGHFKPTLDSIIYLAKKSKKLVEEKAKSLKLKAFCAFHFTFGLFNPDIELETALNILNTLKLPFVIVNFNTGRFIPTLSVEKALEITRSVLGKTSVIIGCMRPYAKWRRKFDEKVVELPIRAIVKPTTKIASTCEFPYCCSFVCYNELNSNTTEVE